MPLPFKKSREEDLSDPAKLLVIDHQKVERLFAEITQSKATPQRQGLVAQLDAELTRHMKAEETVLYPFVRDHVKGGQELMDEAEHEHTEAKETLRRVATLDPSSSDFSSALRELQKLVEHHVKEEEKEVFPKLDDDVDDEQLTVLRGELERVRMQFGPTPDLPADVSPTRRRSSSARGTSGRSATGRTSKGSNRRSGPSNSQSHVWVQPHHSQDGRWQVRRENATRASRVFDTQREAERFGRNVAKRERVELIVAGTDGKVREKRSYGNDPANIPG